MGKGGSMGVAGHVMLWYNLCVVQNNNIINDMVELLVSQQTFFPFFSHLDNIYGCVICPSYFFPVISKVATPIDLTNKLTKYKDNYICV